ncbi:MAG: helix-turn-helix transcriptional regulator [Crocinitomicaceae bacterium]|nr:helix-turn-helix transcriptional regulator [Crocinitomicaceae bacterium]
MISNEEFLVKLGKRIEEAYLPKFKSQTEFALACDVDTRTIRRIIKAEQNPTILVLRGIANALECELTNLIDIE